MAQGARCRPAVAPRSRQQPKVCRARPSGGAILSSCKAGRAGARQATAAAGEGRTSGVRGVGREARRRRICGAGAPASCAAGHCCGGCAGSAARARSLSARRSTSCAAAAATPAQSRLLLRSLRQLRPRQPSALLRRRRPSAAPPAWSRWRRHPLPRRARPHPQKPWTAWRIETGAPGAGAANEWGPLCRHAHR